MARGCRSIFISLAKFGEFNRLECFGRRLDREHSGLLGLQSDLLEFPWGSKSPRHPESCSARNPFRLLYYCGPPLNELLGFLPVVFLAPLFGQAEDNQSTFSECLFLQVAFPELILGNDDPPSFFFQGAYPFNIGSVPREFIFEVDDFMAITLRKSINGLGKSGRKIVV